MKRVAVIGLGAMGAPIAHRLLEAGFPLTVHDNRAEPTRILGDEGATVADNPADCRSVEVVLVVVARAGQVHEVLMGSTGLAAGAARCGSAAETVVVVMSTVGHQTLVELQRQVAPSGIRIVDAPVSGGASHAARGSLSILAAGDHADVEAVRPVMEQLGRVFFCGRTGNAQMIKVANNVIGNLSTLAMAEVTRVLDEHGIDMATASRIFESSSGRNWLSPDPELTREQYSRLSATNDIFDTTTAIVRKDARLALDLAAETGGRFPLIEALATLTETLGDETLENWSAAAHLRR